MLSNLPDYAIEVVLGLVSLLALVLFIIQQKELKRLKESDFTPKPDTKKWDFDTENPSKSYNILQQALKKTQEILGMAELERIKIVDDARIQSREFEKEYEKHLTLLVQQSQSTIINHTKLLQDEYRIFLDDLKLRSEQSQNLIQEQTKQRVNDTMSKFEQNLSYFLTQTEQQSVRSIELELKAARQLIETYKGEQLKLINENIIAVLERTLSLVLSKKLSLKDHMDLVYEALERAKVEKFIA